MKDVRLDAYRRLNMVYYSAPNLTGFLLIDLASMLVKDILRVPTIESQDNTNSLCLLAFDSKEFIVASRRSSIDVFEVRGSKMKSAVRVDLDCSYIYSLVTHPTKPNAVLIGGDNIVALASIL